MTGKDLCEASPDSEAIRRAISRYAKAWVDGDRQGLVACYHDDFTLHYFGNNPLAGVHPGKAAALSILAEVTRHTNRKLVRIVDMMVGAERGGLLVREMFERGGGTVEVERLLIYPVRDGLLWHCWVYDQQQTLIDGILAAGGPFDPPGEAAR
ncbi:nuclear transport factor 2 family protein [Bradyrhizobium erythrophlei]|uniref:nuclear transport factor 2 family protein n=1 Tax=Bradyrhizobium erythrophlei TaxID=1437360 RepID=UPI0035EE936D